MGRHHRCFALGRARAGHANRFASPAITPGVEQRRQRELSRLERAQEEIPETESFAREVGAQVSEDEATRLKLLLEEMCGLRWCIKHELVVWYDGPFCPACELESEQREQEAKEALELYERWNINPGE